MIKSSLTNNIPGSGSSWVSWGTPSAEPSYFTVSWSLGSRILEITKPLADNAIFKKLDIPRIAVTTQEGEIIEEAYTAREANELLLKMLPVSPKVIDSHLIIDQDQITYPASATPAKFQETIHVLTRVNEMEISRSKLRESLSSYTVPDVGTEVDLLQKDLDLILSERSTCENEAETIQAEVESTDISALNNEVAILKEAEANLVKYQRVAAEIESFKDQKVTMEARLEQMRLDEKDILTKWASSEQAAASAKESLATLEYRIQAWKDLTEAKAELEEYERGKSSLIEPVAPEGSKPADSQVEELRGKAGDVQLSLRELQKKIKLADLGCCPECGQRTDKVDLPQLKEKEAELTLVYTQITELLTAVSLKQKEFSDYELEQERHNSAVNRIQEHISRCKDRVSQLAEARPVDQNETDKCNEDITRHEDLVRAKTTLESNISSANSRLQTYDSGITNGTSTLDLLGGTGEPDATRLKVLESKQAHIVDLQTKHASLLGAVSAKTEELNRAQEKLDILQDRAASAEPIKQYRSLLEKAIEILHKNNLPKLVSAQYLNEINAKLDEYLTMVDASFSAWVDSDLQFMVKKSDGLEHRASRLSGGQKQQVSIAYLLSVNDVFASSLGVLALDEPTGSMQEENAKDVAETFSKLVSISKRTDRQFIVITHSETLASYGEVQINLKGYM
jgi:chromosome segregation ATPase